MNLSKPSSEWLLPTNMDYELMYNNLQKSGKYQFLKVDKPQENGKTSFCCSCSFYWVPNTYESHPNSSTDGKSVAKFYTFCEKMSDWTTTCTDQYLNVMLVKSF